MDAEAKHAMPPTPEPIDPTEAVGDPACWANLVCPACGALPDSPEEARGGGRCARCGELYPADD